MARQKKSRPAPETAADIPAELKAGYIADFISGLPVKDTPEERDAVQVFARRLVEDYGYPREFIQTRPQYRVRKRPSDEEKGYPVDVAVFQSVRNLEQELVIVVECKKKTRKDGVAQLKLYLDMSAAKVGVWFNGDEHEYLRKVHHKDGRRTYEPLPNIPRHGQRIEDIGLFKRKDLKKPSNLKAVFRDLRNHLSEAIYEDNQQDAQAGDIFIVRDGTYLVGTSCILTEHDTKILYCGGLYKLRVSQPDKLDPFLLLALLNTPIVRRQMRSKQFTRDIIDTLGKRLFEVVLPLPKDHQLRKRIADETRQVIETRVSLRNRAKVIALEIEGTGACVETEE